MRAWNSGITSRANGWFSQICSCVPAWLRRITKIDMRGLEPAQLAPRRLGRADEPARQRAGQRLGAVALPLLVFVPQIDRARRRPLAIDALAIKAQCELEKRDAVGAAVRLVVGLGAHEIAGQREVRVGHVIAELFLALGLIPRCNRHAPRHLPHRRRGRRARRARADRPSRSSGAANRRPRAAVRLWIGFGTTLRSGMSIFAVMLAAAVPEHRDDRPDRLLPDRPFFLERDAEGLQFSDAGNPPGAELDPAAAHEVKRGDPHAVGRGRCMMPWHRRICLVRWLAAPRNTSGAGECEISSRK